MRRTVLAVLVLVMVVVAPASGKPPVTDLTIRAINPSAGRALLHLSCEPPGGDLPSPALACAALAAAPVLVTDPMPALRFGRPGDCWEITINGRLNGKPIRQDFAACSPSHVPTLAGLLITSGVLRNHLLPRRKVEVPAGTERAFAPGVLSPADRVTCNILGRRLEVGVPTHPRPVARIGDRFATLTVTRVPNGTVRANCRLGDS